MKRIRNIIQKLSPLSDDYSVQLQKFLENIEGDGGIVQNTFDEGGNVSVLFVSSHSMKTAFLDASATIMQVDTSFDFDASKYKLCGFCYLNPTTNKSEFSALAFLSDETAATFRAAFKFFRDMCSQAPSVFMLDKDFTEIGVLKEIFPNASLLLCHFHVIKYLKNLIATSPTTVEISNDIPKEVESAGETEAP